MDATPSLTEPAHWTKSHPLLQSLSETDLQHLYLILADNEPWRDVNLGLTGNGELAWLPTKARLGDTMCLFGGARTFHVIRLDGNEHWKFIGPAYVQGLMDGEAVPSTFSDNDFLWIS
jgi:hypothetical protein